MEGFLQTKIEANLNLEMQLDELRDAYLNLETSQSGEDKNYRKMVENLEKSNNEIS